MILLDKFADFTINAVLWLIELKQQKPEENEGVKIQSSFYPPNYKQIKR